MFQASSTLSDDTRVTAAAVVMRIASLASRRAISSAFVAGVGAQALGNRLGRNRRNTCSQERIDGATPGHSAGEKSRDGVESLVVHRVCLPGAWRHGIAFRDGTTHVLPTPQSSAATSANQARAYDRAVLRFTRLRLIGS
jgi:hypothetical protein